MTMIGDGLSDVSLASILTENDTTLDASEYNLPPIHELPTLVSILHEGDSTSLCSTDSGRTANSTLPIVDNEGSCHGNKVDTGHNRIGEAASIGSSWSLNSADTGVDVPALVLSPLSGISAQIHSAESRAGTGGVTCMSVTLAHSGSSAGPIPGRGGVSTGEMGGSSSPVIVAVGTWHGRCLVFSSVDQVMLFCLGDGRSPEGSDTGAVSCLHLNQSGDRLLAGMARGHILLYELGQGRLLMSFDECFQRSVCVLHIRFCSLASTALFCDSSGCVFELTWQRRPIPLGRVSGRSRCLFSGSRGEVITAEPIPAPPTSTSTISSPGGLSHGHSSSIGNLAQRLVVAMVTMSKVIVLSCRPSLRVLFTQHLSGPLSHPPLLGWQYVMVHRHSGVKSLDPLLTFARQSRLHFIQLEYEEECEEVRFQPLLWTDVPSPLLGFYWLHQGSLLLLDSDEQLWLWHVRKKKHVEKLDLGDTKLVYSASFFKGLATGGNVSKAMSVLGSQCCFESLVPCGGRLWILGGDGVLQVSIRCWLVRLQMLVDSFHYLAALRLAEKMFHDVSGPLVEMNGSPANRRQIIADRMVALVIEWMESRIGLLRSAEDGRAVVPHCVSYLVQLKRLDVLFERANSVFELDSMAHTIYLESLQSFIVSGQIVNVPPLFMKHLVTLYIETNRTQELEECLLSVSLASIDINQVLPLCLSHGLYDTLIRIHTVGMEDYVTPLIEMLTLLGKYVNSGVPLTDAQARLGHKLLVFVSSCLLGKRYPGRGSLPVPLVDAVKWHVLSTVTCVHSRMAPENEQQYPYFRTLLKFDTGAFLDVLSLAFDEPEFGCELGMEQRQRLIDTLLSLVQQSELYTSSQIGALFTFLARQLAQPGSVLSLPDEMFNKLVEHLTESGTSADHEQRQQALTQLIISGVLDSQYCTQTLAQRARDAKLYGVCQLLHERKCEFSAVVDCILQYPGGRCRVHDYIRSRAAHVTGEPSTPPNDALSLFVDNIEALLEIDVSRTAELLMQCFSQHVSDALHRVDANPRLQYQLTTVLLDLDEKSGWILSLFGQLELLHVKLMCQLEPSAVDRFLSFNQRRLLNTEQLIAVCRRYDCDTGQACLLDISGHPDKALDLMMNRLTLLTQQACQCSSLSTITTSNQSNSDNIPSVNTANNHVTSDICCQLPRQLRHQLVTCARLCVRVTSETAAERGLDQWRTLLARALQADQLIASHLTRDMSSSHSDGQSMCQLVISYMSSVMSVSQLFQCLVSAPGKSSATVADLRPLIKGMIESCHYDRILYTHSAALLRRDCAVSVQRRNRLSCRAVSWRADSLCVICHCPATAPPPPTRHGEHSTPPPTHHGEQLAASIHHEDSTGRHSSLSQFVDGSSDEVVTTSTDRVQNPVDDSQEIGDVINSRKSAQSRHLPAEKQPIYVCRNSHVFHMKCLQSVGKSDGRISCTLCAD